MSGSGNVLMAVCHVTEVRLATCLLVLWEVFNRAAITYSVIVTL